MKRLKRVLAIVRHPWMYYLFRKAQEQMVLLYAACEFLHIKDPSVWDVDRLQDALNQILEALYANPHLLDGNEVVMGHLFWTRLLLRFRKLAITREETRRIMEKYVFTTSNMKKGSPSTFDVVLTHIVMVKMFGELA